MPRRAASSPTNQAGTSETWGFLSLAVPNDYCLSTVIYRPLRRPYNETVIYELHVGGFTRNPNSGVSAGKRITLEGQEMDVTTAGLARMNMILHDFPTASIMTGNTLAAPKFKDGEQLRTYDYVVANPPFSNKTWSVGLTPSNDPYQRFAWGEPPATSRATTLSYWQRSTPGSRRSRTTKKPKTKLPCSSDGLDLPRVRLNSSVL